MKKVVCTIVAIIVSFSLAYIVSAADPTPAMSLRHSSIVTPAADAIVETKDTKDATPAKKSIKSKKTTKIAKTTVPPADVTQNQLFLELR